MSNKNLVVNTNLVENLNGDDLMREIKRVTQAVMEEDNLSKSAMMRWLHFGLQMDISETAEAVGVRYQFAYNVISRTAAEKGQEVRVSKARRKPMKPEIIELWQMGLTRNEIHEEMGASKPYIYKVTSEIEDQHGVNVPTKKEAK